MTNIKCPDCGKPLQYCECKFKPEFKPVRNGENFDVNWSMESEPTSAIINTGVVDFGSVTWDDIEKLKTPLEDYLDDTDWR